MSLFRKRPVVIEATQWEAIGNHAAVTYFRRPGCDEASRCDHCDWTFKAHGWIDTLEGGHIVCPGDWVITGVKGECYPCKPDIFDATYDPEPTEGGT